MHTSWLHIVWIIFQVLLTTGFWLPAVLWVVKAIRRKESINNKNNEAIDFAIIVTAYQQTDFLPDVVASIKSNNYNNYHVYIVADNCDISTLPDFGNAVTVFRPETVLAGNIKSHIYALERLVRKHNAVTIIDSDNLLHPDYLKQQALYLENGFVAVQGVRAARNLNTVYACLDEASDIYYRYVDRLLSFGAGSSSTLAGSGMAFEINAYRKAIDAIELNGAGFDKMLQYQLVQSGNRLAFNENAIVFDGKTTKSDQLVKQRARWISAWAKAWLNGWNVLASGIVSFNWNKIVFSNALLRPPLFMLGLLSVICIIIDLFFMPAMLWFWLGMIFVFFIAFFAALEYFKAERKIYKALLTAPKFVFLQILALLKAGRANKISVATKHEI